MKLNPKIFLTLSFLLFCLCITLGAFAQEPDTTVIIGDDFTNKFPWLSILVTAVIAAIPTFKWVKSHARAKKFEVLVKVVLDAVADRKIDDSEVKATIAALKDLVAKDKE